MVIVKGTLFQPYAACTALKPSPRNAVVSPLLILEISLQVFVREGIRGGGMLIGRCCLGGVFQFCAPGCLCTPEVGGYHGNPIDSCTHSEKAPFPKSWVFCYCYFICFPVALILLWSVTPLFDTAICVHNWWAPQEHICVWLLSETIMQ